MLLFAILIFSLVLLYPPPAAITSLLSNFNIRTALIVMVFLGLVFAKQGLVWETSSLVLVNVLFGLPLIYEWQAAKFTGFLLGGLLPFSDANVYYGGAQSLMSGGFLNEIATNRPIFTGFFAVLLTFTGNNLQASLAILAVFNGTAAFLAAREIQKMHNAPAAAIFVLIVYWYHCRGAGTTMTETLGLPFGCLGLAFLLQGGKRKILWQIGFGFFLLTLALNIRAGAFFILPALFIWFWITYKKDFGWKGPLFVSLAVLVAMTSNVVIKRVIGNPEGALFANYSYTLYGLASGNAGWSQVQSDYPNATADEIFGLAINKIKSKPALFGLGMVRAFQEYFSMHNGAFSFLRLVSDNDTGNRLLWVLTWAGVVTALLDGKQSLSWMVLLAFLGILLSTVLVPPKDADAMRVYAATLPVNAYLASLGILLPTILLKNTRLFSSPLSAGEWTTDHLLLPFSLGLLFVCLIFPFAVKSIGHSPQVDGSLVCSPGEVQILFLMGNHSSVRLVRDNVINESYLPAISVSKFRNGTRAIPRFYPFLTRELVNLQSGHAISIGGFRKVTSQNLEPMKAGYLITDGHLPRPGLHQICVTPANDENLRDTLFYDFNASGEKSQDLSFVQKYPSLTKVIRLLYGLGLLAILLGAFDFWSIGPARKLYVIGSLVLIIVGILANLHSTLIYPLTWERRLLQADQAVFMEGYSYKIDLGVNWMDRKSLGISPVVVYENGIPLKRPNSSRFSIQQRGKGRFSVEEGFLYFSASDNSNPKENGRTYEIYWPTPMPRLYEYFFYLSFMIGMFFLIKFYYHHRRERDGSGLERKHPKPLILQDLA